MKRILTLFCFPLIAVACLGQGNSYHGNFTGNGGPGPGPNQAGLTNIPVTSINNLSNYIVSLAGTNGVAAGTNIVTTTNGNTVTVNTTNKPTFDLGLSTNLNPVNSPSLSNYVVSLLNKDALPVYYFQEFGGTNDGSNYNNTITQPGSTAVTIPTANFTSVDVGKTMMLWGCGTSNTVTNTAPGAPNGVGYITTNLYTFISTIASVTSPTVVQLASPVVNGVTNFPCIYGSDNTPFLQTALNQVSLNGGGVILFTNGTFCFSSIYSPLIDPGNDTNHHNSMLTNAAVTGFPNAYLAPTLVLEGPQRASIRQMTQLSNGLPVLNLTGANLVVMMTNNNVLTNAPRFIDGQNFTPTCLYTNGSAYGVYENNINLSIQNLNFITPAAPNMRCLSLEGYPTIYLQSITVTGGYNEYTDPTNSYTNSVGIALPAAENAGSVYLNDVSIAGFHTALQSCEHVSVENTICWDCTYAWDTYNGGGHWNVVNNFDVESCFSVFNVRSPASFKGNITTENVGATYWAWPAGIFAEDNTSQNGYYHGAGTNYWYWTNSLGVQLNGELSIQFGSRTNTLYTNIFKDSQFFPNEQYLTYDVNNGSTSVQPFDQHIPGNIYLSDYVEFGAQGGNLNFLTPSTGGAVPLVTLKDPATGNTYAYLREVFAGNNNGLGTGKPTFYAFGSTGAGGLFGWDGWSNLYSAGATFTQPVTNTGATNISAVQGAFGTLIVTNGGTIEAPLTNTSTGGFTGNMTATAITISPNGPVNEYPQPYNVWNPTPTNYMADFELGPVSLASSSGVIIFTNPWLYTPGLGTTEVASVTFTESIKSVASGGVDYVNQNPVTVHFTNGATQGVDKPQWTPLGAVAITTNSYFSGLTGYSITLTNSTADAAQAMMKGGLIVQ